MVVNHHLSQISFWSLSVVCKSMSLSTGSCAFMCVCYFCQMSDSQMFSIVWLYICKVIVTECVQL